jgi:hypothetical protein
MCILIHPILANSLNFEVMRNLQVLLSTPSREKQLARNDNGSVCSSKSLQDKVVFVIPHNMCVVNKFVIFIHSNIQYEMSIVTHITLKWPFDIRWWHISHTCFAHFWTSHIVHCNGWKPKSLFQTWVMAFCVRVSLLN